MKALLFLMITTLLTFGAPNVVADDLQTAGAAEFGVERPPPVWPAQEPAGPFMMVAMIIPVFVLLAMAIQIVTFAYRSARTQIRRKLMSHRPKGAFSLHGYSPGLLPTTSRSSLLEIVSG